MPVIQGPSSYKITGHLQEFRENPLSFLRRLTEYGEVAAFRLSHKRFYLTLNPQMIKDVVVTKTSCFQSVKSVQVVKAFSANNLFFREEALYMHLIQPSFVKKHLLQFKNEILQVVQNHIRKWKDGEVRTVLKDMRNIVFEALIKGIFNLDTDSEHSLIKCLQTLVSLRGRDSLHSMIKVPLPLPIKQQRVQNETINHLLLLIEEMITQRKQSDEQVGDLCHLLLQHSEDYLLSSEGEGLIKQQLISLFFTMYETITHTCSWSIYLLCQNEEDIKRLQKELDNEAANHSLTDVHLAKLSYLHKVITECMRLYPSIWLFGRKATQDIQLDGYHLRKNDTVLISPYMMHRNENYFLEPYEFLPDRFQSDFLSDVPDHIYMPFGINPRVEVGMSYVLEMVAFILVPIISSFNIKAARNNIIEPDPHVLLRMKDELNIIVSIR
ncbi:cytochrome P450 [Priestia megaterium]|nr:cytochrome P450 [Priestia megaterium]